MPLNSMLKHAVTWFFSKTPRIQHLIINEVVLGNITEGIVTTVQVVFCPRKHLLIFVFFMSRGLGYSL